MEHLHLRNEPVFCQHLTLKLFEQNLSSTFKIDTHALELSTVEFTYEEENAVRYMGGNVLKKLKDKNQDIEFLVDSKKQ